MSFLGVALPALLGAGGILGSKLLEGASADEQRKADQAALDRNIDLQREFAQWGVRWKVADAKAAGIHPLFAMGAQTHSFSPVSVGSSSDPSSANMVRSLASLGQDTSRAVHATRTDRERIEANALMTGLQIENQSLQNDLLRSQVVRMNQGVGPSLPSNSGMPLLTGQGNSNPTAQSYVEEQPLKRTHSQPGAPQQDVGAIPDYGFARTRSGYAVIPSKDVKERIEDQFVPETMWSLRNQIFPFFKGVQAPDPKYYPLPKGFNAWVWNPLSQEFVPGNRGMKPRKWGPYGPE